MNEMFTVIDLGNCPEVEILGLISKEKALEISKQRGGQVNEQGCIYLDDEGWVVAIPHNCENCVDWQWMSQHE